MLAPAPRALLATVLLLVASACDDGWGERPTDDDDSTFPVDDDDATVDDDDTTADDDDSSDDDDSTADDDDSGDDDDDSTADDDDSSDDDDSTADDDDSTPGDDDDSTPDPDDADGDGFDAIGAGGDDCNDIDSSVNPGAPEDPTNGADDDCDGTVDEPLAVTSLSRPDGIATGNTLVLVHGQGFGTLVSIELGGVVISGANLISENQIEISTPGGPVGDVDLVVTTQFDTVTIVDAFRYTGAASTLDSSTLLGPAEATVVLGNAAGPFTATLTEAGLTGLGSAPVGVIAQIGWGSQGQLPSTFPDWWWSPASWVQADGAADLYSASVTPDMYGSWVVTFRFSVDGGYQWIFADTAPGTALSAVEMSVAHVTP